MPPALRKAAVPEAGAAGANAARGGPASVPGQGKASVSGFAVLRTAGTPPVLQFRATGKVPRNRRSRGTGDHAGSMAISEARCRARAWSPAGSAVISDGWNRTVSTSVTPMKSSHHPR